MAEPKRREWIDRQLIAALKGPVKRGDSELRSILVGLVLLDLAAAAVVTVMGHGALVVLVGAWVVVVALTPVIMFGFRRYSEGGMFWFLIALPIFLGWNWIALWLVTLSGAAVGHPRVGWVITELLGVMPLVITIMILTRKLRQRIDG